VKNALEETLHAKSSRGIPSAVSLSLLLVFELSSPSTFAHAYTTHTCTYTWGGLTVGRGGTGEGGRGGGG
jgi:hypothetical protein